MLRLLRIKRMRPAHSWHCVLLQASTCSVQPSPWQCTGAKCGAAAGVEDLLTECSVGPEHVHILTTYFD